MNDSTQRCKNAKKKNLTQSGKGRNYCRGAEKQRGRGSLYDILAEEACKSKQQTILELSQVEGQ
jgi:hypothetical protein